MSIIPDFLSQLKMGRTNGRKKPETPEEQKKMLARKLALAMIEFRKRGLLGDRKSGTGGRNEI